MASNGFFVHQRNAHRNGNASTTLKRQFDNRGFRDFQEERIRYAPPQKRPRSQTQTHGAFPLYHGSNMSRVSDYGDVIGSNSSNNFTFPLRNNDSLPSNADYQKSYGYRNPNSQFVPLPLPYRKLDDDVSFDLLPEWNPNRSHVSNFPVRSSNPVSNTIRDITVTASTNSPMNHSNMVSIVSQALPQAILSKDLSDLLSCLNNEKEKENPEAESPLGLDFDPAKLKVRNESVIKSLYSDMPRQCSSCGVRFKSQEDHSNHMDWHVRKNRTANKTSTRSSQKPKKSRVWLASSSLWLSAATGGGTIEADKACFDANGETQKKKEEDEEHVVPADEDQKMCALCEEPFEDFFSHEADEWLYKGAVYLNSNESGPIVHAKCMPETRKGHKPSVVMSVTVP